MSRRLWAVAALLCAAFALAACGDIGRFPASSPIASPIKPNRTVAQTPAAEREHERILSSYGGAYDDPKLEALIGKTVDRLVAASDRPDQAYKVTILNSGAVNAFALPTGQLYVTRGLIALASDTRSEERRVGKECRYRCDWSSDVCSSDLGLQGDDPEFGRGECVRAADRPALRDPRPDRAGQRHLGIVLGAVARDGARAGKTRIDPRGPGAPGRHRHPRRYRHEQRSRSHRACAGQNQADDGKLFTRPGIRGGRYRRRPFGARPFRPLWRGAFPGVDGAQCRAEGRKDLARSAHAGLPVVAPGNAGARTERAGQRQTVYLAGGRRTRSRNLSLRHRQHRLRRGSERGIRSGPALPASQARLHLRRAR